MKERRHVIVDLGLDSYMNPMVRKGRLGWATLLFTAVALSSTLVACSSPKPLSAEGDLSSDLGYKIHFRVDVAKAGLDPLAYQVTLVNVGKKPLTFKPNPPDCTLFLDPNNYSPTIFRRTQASGMTSSDENGAITLKPGDTCTLQLEIEDMESPLRGSAHDCQLGIKPIDPDAAKKTDDPYAGVIDPASLKSNIFRISVP